jgi:hypothetical protein
MRKLKKSLKKRKGLKARIERQEFLHALKHGKPKVLSVDQQSAKDILKKIRNRRNNSSPYDASTNGMMKKIRRLTGLE